MRRCLRTEQARWQEQHRQRAEAGAYLTVCKDPLRHRYDGNELGQGELEEMNPERPWIWIIWRSVGHK